MNTHSDFFFCLLRCINRHKENFNVQISILDILFFFFFISFIFKFRRSYKLFKFRRNYKNLLSYERKNGEIIELNDFPDFCEHCGAQAFTQSRNTKGKFGRLCCRNGAIKIRLPEYPQELMPIWDLQTSQGKVIFQTHQRSQFSKNGISAKNKFQVHNVLQKLQVFPEF